MNEPLRMTDEKKDEEYFARFIRLEDDAEHCAMVFSCADEYEEVPGDVLSFVRMLRAAPLMLDVCEWLREYSHDSPYALLSLRANDVEHVLRMVREALAVVDPPAAPNTEDRTDGEPTAARDGTGGDAGLAAGA